MEWYPAKYVKSEIGDGKYGEYCRFQFEVLEGTCSDGETDAKGTLVSAMCDADLALGSKMYDFVCGITGDKLELDDTDIDLTAYYGDKYEVCIEAKKKKGQDKIHNNVVKIRKPKKKKKSKKKK